MKNLTINNLLVITFTALSIVLTTIIFLTALNGLLNDSQSLVYKLF